LLMTITNIFYTKYNMEMTNTGQQQMPGMKAMMYIDAVDVLGVLQPVCFRFDVLLFHLYVDHNRADIDLPLYDQ